jgi:hypothetical protein
MNGSEGIPPEAGAPTAPVTSVPPQPVLPDAIVDHLAGAAPWVRFMAVLGFIGVGLMVLFGLIILVLGFPIPGAVSAPPLRFLGIVYMVLAAIYMIPLLPLNRFAAAAGRLKKARSYEVATEALRQNRSFWFRAGVMTIIFTALGILGMIVGMVVAFVIGMAARS